MALIRCTCEVVVDCQPQAIAKRIRDITGWPDFPGYGPLPRIESAEFGVETDDMVGSCVRVTNEDGSERGSTAGGTGGLGAALDGCSED